MRSSRENQPTMSGMSKRTLHEEHLKKENDELGMEKVVAAESLVVLGFTDKPLVCKVRDW